MEILENYLGDANNNLIIIIELQWKGAHWQIKRDLSALGIVVKQCLPHQFLGDG